MSVEEEEDVECSQKMIDSLLQSIKLETRSLTSTIALKTPAGARGSQGSHARMGGTAERQRIESLNASRKEEGRWICNTTQAQAQRRTHPSTLTQMIEKENEGDRMNISNINRTFLSASSPFDVYDREFVRSLINRLNGDNAILHQNGEDYLRVMNHLGEQCRSLRSENAGLKVQNNTLRKEAERLGAIAQENTLLRLTVLKYREKIEKVATHFRECVRQTLSYEDESEVLLHQAEAENHKLRLALKIGEGQEVPKEELEELKVQERKALAHSKSNKVTESLGTDDLYASIVKTELKEDEPLHKGDMLSDFLKDNDIVEQDQEYFGADYADEDDEDAMVVFGDKKRRDSF